MLIKRGDATIHALATFSGPRSMCASSNLFEFLKQPRMEGYSLFLYDHDGAGNTTIGAGHLVHLGKKDSRNPSEKPFKNGITDQQAEQLFWEDVKNPTSEIDTDVRVPLTQNQFDALVSLIFNIGVYGFSTSTVLKLLNCGDYLGAARHFEDFHYSHHQSVSGLTWRRRNEEALFLRR